jgi:aryl-alcohol dehydrogenase-like predicted oxidoreductase
MRYGPLGQSGLLVSVVGLGCNNFGSRLDVDGTRAVVDAAIDAGITLFDTSDTYGGGGGSERALGEILGPLANGLLTGKVRRGQPIRPEPGWPTARAT